MKFDDENELQGKVDDKGEPGNSSFPAEGQLVMKPTFWPAIRHRPEEWEALRKWVEELVARYPHLDHGVIPKCWYLHPGHVEALAALRDHERLSFAPGSPLTSPVDWQYAFARIEERLRQWTRDSGCLGTHRPPMFQPDPPSDDEWRRFLEQQAEG